MYGNVPCLSFVLVYSDNYRLIIDVRAVSYSNTIYQTRSERYGVYSPPPPAPPSTPYNKLTVVITTNLRVYLIIYLIYSLNMPNNTKFPVYKFNFLLEVEVGGGNSTNPPPPIQEPQSHPHSPSSLEFWIRSCIRNISASYRT